MKMKNLSFSGLMFQDGLSPQMEKIIFFHDGMNALLMLISFMVLGAMLSLLIPKGGNLKFVEEKNLELFWSIVPALFLISVAIPSLTVLFSESPTGNVYNTIKVVGLQWYWSYEYSDDPFIGDCVYDSYMSQEKKLVQGDLRNLEVDLPLFIYFGKWVRFLISSADVIHSFAVPSFGLKVDAVPGRINQGFVFPQVVGKFYGQCSEICGANHSFMPISVEVLYKKKI